MGSGNSKPATHLYAIRVYSGKHELAGDAALPILEIGHRNSKRVPLAPIRLRPSNLPAQPNWCEDLVPLKVLPDGTHMEEIFLPAQAPIGAVEFVMITNEVQPKTAHGRRTNPNPNPSPFTLHPTLTYLTTSSHTSSCSSPTFHFSAQTHAYPHTLFTLNPHTLFTLNRTLKTPFPKNAPTNLPTRTLVSLQVAEDPSNDPYELKPTTHDPRVWELLKIEIVQLRRDGLEVDPITADRVVFPCHAWVGPYTSRCFFPAGAPAPLAGQLSGNARLGRQLELEDRVATFPLVANPDASMPSTSLFPSVHRVPIEVK